MIFQNFRNIRITVVDECLVLELGMSSSEDYQFMHSTLRSFINKGKIRNVFLMKISAEIIGKTKLKKKFLT